MMTETPKFDDRRDRAVDELPYGTIVHDREDDDPNDGVVVNVAPAPADDWEAYDSMTVAEDNPNYPSGAAVVAVTFREYLDETIPEWRERDTYIPFNVLDERAGFYSFPAPRLEVVEPAEAVLQDDTDTDTDQPAINSESEQDVDDDQAEPDTESTPAPGPEIEALADHLGADEPAPIEHDPDAGHYVVLEKLGEVYHVQPGGKLLKGADGALADRVQEVATDL